MNANKLANDSQEGRLAPAPLILFVLLLFSIPSSAQQIPNKIRGYKVHQDKVIVNKTDGDAVVKIGEPDVIEASLTGITFELPAEIQAPGQSGKVDFLAFHDFKVNGISVEPEEYMHKFEFRKGENVKLPNPARIFLPATSIVRAAWMEMHESKAEWNVTGRVFVFGRFRKLGFYHKRVIPIDIDIKVKNPLYAATRK